MQYNQSKNGSVKYIMRSYRASAISIIFLFLTTNVKESSAQFCKELAPPTLTNLHNVLDNSFGYAPLCPFEIKGSNCDTTSPYRVNASFFQMVCAAVLGDIRGCKIECEGSHIEVQSGILIMQGFTFGLATEGSIIVKVGATLYSYNGKFIGNDSSNNGGAISAEVGSGLELYYNEFYNNNAMNDGGALYLQCAHARIIGCTFVENTAERGALFAGQSSGRISIGQSTFAANKMELDGAAIYLESETVAFLSVSNTGCDNEDNEGNCDGVWRQGSNGDGGSCDEFTTKCLSPTRAPTKAPAPPTPFPTGLPTRSPTKSPTKTPTISPTTSPSLSHSESPTGFPTRSPTKLPTKAPTTSPTMLPSISHSESPSKAPTTSPTMSPSISHSESPTGFPTRSPTKSPSKAPTTSPTVLPSLSHSESPTISHSAIPTIFQSSNPSKEPSAKSSSFPTLLDSSTPSIITSSEPTSDPTITSPFSRDQSNLTDTPTSISTLSKKKGITKRPSSTPALRLSSKTPTAEPTMMHSSAPSRSPTDHPSSTPTLRPTAEPTLIPSSDPSTTTSPSGNPSSSPTLLPTSKPTLMPSSAPSASPSGHPSSTPTLLPTSKPTLMPSSAPSASPSGHPSSTPTLLPTSKPTLMPSSAPSTSMMPSSAPSTTISPSGQPSSTPTLRPTAKPTLMPSSIPSTTISPSGHPSNSPTLLPTADPTLIPSYAPSRSPTDHPSNSPTLRPTVEPTLMPSSAPSKTTSPSGHPSSQPTLRPTATVTEDVTKSTGMLAPEFNENCPCFTAESLDIAVTQVASGAFTFNPEKTCTGSATGSDGIIYNDFSREHPAIMGFEVMEGECREADALYLIDGQQNASCRELLAAKCSEHASVIAAASLATATKDGCEHFSAKDVSPVVDRLNAGLVTANKNNCQEFSIGYSSSLSWMEDDIAREYSTTFDESTGEYKVVADDHIFITDSATNNACAAIVDNACKSLKSVKKADGCEYFSKLDMDGIVEAMNGGVVVAAENSCPEVSIGGSTQTLSWFEDISDGKKAFRTYSASWDESLEAPVVQMDDQIHRVEFEVMSSCSAVIKTACDMIKGKPDDGVISINGGD